MRVSSGWIFGILLLGFALRVWGLAFGLPDLYHADEPIVVNHAAAYGTGDFHPHFFKIPPLVSYLLFFVYGIYFLGARALNVVGSLHDFQALFLTDPSSFYLLARFIFGAILGTLTLYLLYKLIDRHFSRDRALLASFFLAVSFLHVRDSHYIYVDIPLLLVLVGCFFFLFRISEGGRGRDYLFFGLLAGTAAATKYNGVFIFIPFLLAHLIRICNKATLSPSLRGVPPLRRDDEAISMPRLLRPFGARNDVSLVIGTVLVSTLAYGLLNPFSWLDFSFFLKELLTQGGSTGYVGPWHPLKYSFLGGLGWGIGAPALAGMLWTVIRPERKRVLFLSFALFYYCPVLVFFSQPYDRYILPLIPIAVFFAADFLIRVSKRISLGRLFFLALVLLAAAPSLGKVVLSNRLFSAQDVRTEAREWIEANLPSGTKIALDAPFSMPRLKPTPEQLEERKNEVLSGEEASRAKLKKLDALLEEANRRRGEKRYELYFLKDRDSKGDFLSARPSLPYRLEDLEERGIQYVVVAQIHPGENAFFREELLKVSSLVARFSPYRDRSLSWAVDRLPLTGGPFLWRELVLRKQNGEIIEIYKLG